MRGVLAALLLLFIGGMVLMAGPSIDHLQFSLTTPPGSVIYNRNSLYVLRAYDPDGALLEGKCSYLQDLTRLINERDGAEEGTSILRVDPIQSDGWVAVSKTSNGECQPGMIVVLDDERVEWAGFMDEKAFHEIELVWTGIKQQEANAHATEAAFARGGTSK